ncbi:MAG: GAF domain-containing protein [Chloroflexota bacterium]
MEIGPVLLAIVLGASVLVAVYFLARGRREDQRFVEKMPQAVVPVNLVDNDNAVIVAEGRGHLVFANGIARNWFEMNGGEPNLEMMADAVQPADAFLELFGKEGQASFRIGARRIEATSHYIPHPDNAQMVVVMKEMAMATYDKRALDPVQAMSVVSEITQTISGSLKLDQTLDSILNSIGSIVAFDAAEITLWDEDLQILRPLGQGGDIDYIDRLNNTDGVYQLDDSFSGWIARYRQPLLISDIPARADVTPKIKDYPFVSFIGLPLTVGERFIGTLEMASRTRAAYDHEDMILLQAIAGQAAIAIENARLFQSQTERVTELSGLQQISAAMTSLTDARQMYMQLTSRIAGLMNIEMCGILLYDNQLNALVSQAPFFGVPDAIVALYRIPLDENSTAYALYTTRDWWYSNNVRNDDMVRLVGLLNLAEAVGVRTTALVPMIIGNRRFGVVQASNKRDGSGFSENDVRLLSIFASQAAIVVENARLYNEEQRRADELGGLQQISQAIGVLRNADQLYGQISERIGKLMGVQMCGILLYDKELQQLVSQMPFYGVDNDLTRYYQINVPQGSALYALYNEKEYWISNDLRNDPIVREGGLDRLTQLLGVRQILLVPLIVGGRRLGSVQISNKQNSTEFTEEDARILLIFASQAAVIIDNARLYREMRQRADEAEGLRRIAEVASGNLPLDASVKAVLNETQQLLNSDMVFLGLLDDLTGELTIRPEWSIGLAGLSEPFSMDVYSPDFQTSVVITKRTFMTNDLRNDGQVLPVYRAMADRFNYDAVIQVPLVVRERGIGELSVANRGDKSFIADDVRLVQAVAVQLAAAVERNRLYVATDADLRARIQELDSLTRVSNELNLTIQLERILEVIRHEAQRTTDADAATVILLGPAEQWTSPTEPLVEQRLGTDAAITGIAAIEREAIEREAFVAVSNYEVSDFEAQPPQARSAVAAPIQYGEQIAGVLHLYSDKVDGFGKQSQDFVKALTNQAAIAVGNSVRYRQQLERSDLLKQRAEQLSQIFELGRTLRSQDSIEQVLDAVAYGVTQATDFRMIVISLTEASTGLMRRVAQAGFTLDRFKEIQKTSPTLAQIEKLFQSRYRISSSYFLPSEERASWAVGDLPIVSSPFTAGVHAEWQPDDLLLVPLRNPTGGLMGLMSVDAPANGKRPSLQTVEALEIFAHQAAFAIENYQLVQAFQAEAEATRRERDRLAQLYLVASEIQRAADIPTRMQVVADGIRAAGWGRVAITLRDTDYEALETITSGYSSEAAGLYRANLLSGIVWSQRLTDPDFRQYRIGQAYYLRNSDPWVTENKLIAGNNSAEPLTPDAASTVWHSQDTVYLPLYGLDRSRLIGIISMDSPLDGKAPTEASMRPIELFAVQASSAIENTRLYQETQRSAQQEARINEVMEAVASTLDMDEIIRSVSKGLQQMIAFTRMSVSLLDRSESKFDVTRVNIDMRGEISVVPGEPVEVENSATGLAHHEAVARVYHLSESENTANYTDLKAWRDSGERTTLIVPMVAGGRVIGTLHMGSELANAFGFEDQLPLVARMANLTAIAIENARLFQQSIDRERFSSALGRVGQSVNAMLDMTSVLDTVCEESINILNVEGAYIWLVEDSDLVGFASRGPGADTFVGTRRLLANDQTLGAAVVRERSPLFDNHLSSPDNQYKHVLKGIKVEAALGVPLLREDQAVGTLIFIQTDPTKQFSIEDIEPAQAFATQAAIAIESARLYQETLGLKSFNEAIIQSIQQGIVVLDRTTTISTINAFMRRNYGWDERGIGMNLFDYRPNYIDFLQFAIFKVLQTGQPEVQYDIQEMDQQGNDVVRNFYVYALLEGEAVNGVVLLVEDVTARTALEADVEMRSQQLSVLTEVSGRLTATLDPDSVVAVLLDQLGRILTFDNVTLWLRRDNNLVIRAARGYIDAESLIGIEAEIADSDLFREIASRGQVLNIPDITQDSRFPASQDRPVRSWLGVSLVSQSNLAGLLVLEKSQTNFYTPMMEQLALTFANQAAIALENARLFQEVANAADENTRLYRETAERAQKLDQQTQRLSLFNRVSSALAQSLDIENVFEVTLREIVQVLGMDRGSAYLFEIEQQRGRLIVEYPRGDMPPTGTYISLENPLMVKLRQTLQAVIIQDTRTDENIQHAREMLNSQRVLSMLIVPLAVGGQAIGSLSLDSTSQVREFTPEQIEIAQTIASQAAIAVQNSSLFEQSVIRTRELETLFEATQSISLTLDLDAVLSNTAQQMLFALQVDHCEISYWDNVENRLKIALDLDRFETETHVVTPASENYSLSNFPTRERVLESRQVVIIRLDETNSELTEQQALEERGATGRIILPMVVREQAIGLIILETREPGRRFSLNEVRLVRTLASQAAVAIDNARLQTETASKLEELFVINELSTALSSSIEQEGIFKVVRTQLPSLVKAQSLLLAVLDEDHEQVSYPVALRNGKPIEIPDHPVGDDEVSFVLKRRSAQYLAGDEIEDVLRNLKVTLRITKARCFLGVPMIAGDEVVGALILSDEVNPRAFTLDDQRVLSTVAAQLAVAIQNSRLFARTRQFTAELEKAVLQRTEELQQERDRIEFLYRITTGLTSSLDMDMVLSRALEMMAQAVDADLGIILGIDSISGNLIYRATVGLPNAERERSLSFSQHEGLAGWVIQSQQSVIVNDVQSDPRWLRLSELDDEPRSAIAALMEANEDVLGVVTLYSRQPNHFSDDQLRLVIAAANQVASAMNNAELYGLIREQAERLAAMVRREQVDATKNAAIVESIADGVMVADQGGDIVQFNSAAERILALPRTHVIGQHISELAGLYASSGGTVWLDAIQRWMDDPTSYKPGGDVQVQLNLDNDRFVSVILSPVNMGDQFLGTVSVFRDITREIEVDRMKSEFVATVSHELRTPMTSIKGYADLLLLGAAGQVTEQQQRFLSTIKTNADRLSILVNELLDISRIDRGMVQLKIAPTDIREIIDASVNHLEGRISAEKKELQVVVNVPEDLPQIRADFDKFTQIVNNLIDNAFNYTLAGGTVTIAAKDEGNSVLISVADTGIGIPQEKQERIWQRFFRDDDQDLVKATSGTGLGLSIVKEYVTMHNGEIWLESEQGKGTTFYVRIPVFVPATMTS